MRRDRAVAIGMLPPNESYSDTAVPAVIAEVMHVLRGLRAPWAVAGGWAIDLAVGRVTRPHADVDVLLPREDQAALRMALPEWEFRSVVDGALSLWLRGARLDTPVHEVHATPPVRILREVRGIEFLLNERDGMDWVYRRDSAVRRPLSRIFREGWAGVRTLAPEVVLLYKSKAPREADEHDFQTALPLLGDESRRWLAAALCRADARHSWLRFL